MKMKAMPFVLVTAIWLPAQVYSQGSFVFGNYVLAGPPPVTISAIIGTFNPPNGPGGAFVGADYTASLCYLIGTVTDQAIFDSSSPILVSNADTRFFGTTGTGPTHGFDGDGSGFFYRGIVSLPTTGTVTIQVRGWYNGGGLYTSYAQALAAGQNVGESNPVSVDLATGLANPPNMDGLLPFTVGIVPEPSTLALFALSGLTMLFLHRRK
jgi:hypothetical protein